MTAPERDVQTVLDLMFSESNQFKFVGNRGFWLIIGGEKPKNPDFANINAKKAIEVFGEYWHRDEDPRSLIGDYNAVGWECLVVWEQDARAYGSLRERILEFAYPYEYDFEVEEFNKELCL